jgi:hypothetical protein
MAPNCWEDKGETADAVISDVQVRSSVEWRLQDVDAHVPRPCYSLRSSTGRGVSGAPTNKGAPAAMASDASVMVLWAACADSEGRSRVAGLNRKDGVRVSWEDEHRGDWSAGRCARMEDAGLVSGARHARDEDDAPLSDGDDTCPFHAHDADDSLEEIERWGEGEHRVQRVSNENPFAKYLRGTSSDVATEGEEEPDVGQDVCVAVKTDQQEVRMSWREREAELKGLADVANGALLAREQPYTDVELPWIKVCLRLCGRCESLWHRSCP